MKMFNSKITSKQIVNTYSTIVKVKYLKVILFKIRVNVYDNINNTRISKIGLWFIKAQRKSIEIIISFIYNNSFEKYSIYSK